MAGKVKLTERQATALARLVRVFSPRAIDRKEATRRGLLASASSTKAAPSNG